MDEANALRQLPEIQNIAEYLRTMEFRKKLIGGVDAGSVLEHFSAVTLQYEAVVSAFMRQAEAYARRLAEAEALLRGQEERAVPAAQPSQPQPWHEAAYPQQAQQAQTQQPCAAHTPWEQAYSPWAQQPAPQEYTPWAQQPAPQEYTPWEQAYAPPGAPASAWQEGAQALPEPPSYMYA